MKYLVTVRPANAPILEFLAEGPDKLDESAATKLADDARMQWYRTHAGQVELSVSIELEEWAETGHFGTGDDGDSIPD